MIRALLAGAVVASLPMSAGACSFGVVTCVVSPDSPNVGQPDPENPAVTYAVGDTYSADSVCDQGDREV